MRLTRCYDLELIARLDREIFHNDSPLSQRELSGSDWWVLLDGTQAAGFCGASTYTEEGTSTRCVWLERAGVCAAYRGKRLQRRMILVRMKHGRALGCTQARTYTAAHNVQSMRSLTACGFRPYAHEEDETAGELLYWARYL